MLAFFVYLQEDGLDGFQFSSINASFSCSSLILQSMRDFLTDINFKFIKSFSLK